MYKKFQRIFSDFTTITPLDAPPKPEEQHEEEQDEPIPENDFYNELPIDYFKRDDNDSPDADNIYSYKFNNKYHYREFAYLQDELNKRYDFQEPKNVHLCIYAFNDTCFYNREPYPFLQFLAQRQNEKFIFPSFLFENPPNIDEEDLQIHFTNNCLTRVLDFFVIEGSNLYKYATENMNRSYRGYIHHNGDIYVVYDMTNFVNLKMRKTKDAEWCVLTELINENQTNARVVDLFQKYKCMNTIDSVNSINQPIAMYLYDIEKREPITKITDLLEPRSNHPNFGKFYYFVKTRPNHEFVKCAIFIENMVVIGQEKGIPAEVSDTDSLEYSEESSEESDTSEMDTSNKHYTLPFTSMIQFYENEKIVCVKTESLFTYLQN